MCRHLGYLGPPIPLSAVLFDPGHALVRQSWAPLDMRRGGTINADGFGVGWYVDGGPPVRYRRHAPMWTDADLPDLARATVSGAVLAAVRSATVGMPVVDSAVAPFAEGRWLFSHNGAIAGWPETVTGLAATLPTRDLLTLDAPTDSALLWALVRHRLRAGSGLATAVLNTLVAVTAAAPGSRLNLLLTDGVTLVGTTVGHALSVMHSREACRSGDRESSASDGAVLISSEPLDDDPGWQPVPEGRLVVATPSTVDISPLPEETRVA